MRRVVITGLGTVNALGNDVETSFSRMLEGESRRLHSAAEAAEGKR